MDNQPGPSCPDTLKRPLEGEQLEKGHQPVPREDPAAAKAEETTRNESNTPSAAASSGERAAKRVKLDVEKLESNGVHLPPKAGSFDAPAVPNAELEHSDNQSNGVSKTDTAKEGPVDSRDRVKGVAMVKPEYLLNSERREVGEAVDDDIAEGRAPDDRDKRGDGDRGGKNKRKQKQKGQNKNREFGSWYDDVRLCNTRANSDEFSPKECQFGEKCNCSHDLRKYLKEGKREDLTTFNGLCPVYEVNGSCYAGWKCRFVGSHSKEITREDGRKELVLLEKPDVKQDISDGNGDNRKGVYNVVSTKEKLDLSRKRTKAEKADKYTAWLDQDQKEMEKIYHQKRDASTEAREENRAQFVDQPLLPSEKRRIYFGAETPVLAPLTTQGNLPFRRMCVDFGAQITYSEMAMSTPLIQGQKSEWALMKAHESEITPPRYTPTSIVEGYDNSKDLKFGVQISANKPWQALKAAEVMSKLLPHLRVIDLNCGCPIDMVYKQGGGSGLLDAPSKLEKIIRGMNVVSGDIPITAKIRMGTQSDKPTAQKLIDRLAFGGVDVRERLGAPGCAAITLHGRSRQQRYTKNADWSYIAECAALVKSYNLKKDDITDTIREADERTQPNTPGGRMYFIGNGDCYSHVQYNDDIVKSGVDSVMIARGALVKPWIFEEIEKGQYIDKSASERLGYVERFCRYGLEAWGSDEVGVGQTRRFLLEWLSFAHRYVPIGLLTHLPPSLQERPPAYRGRSDLETLLASDNYLDWIKISEMFLGPAHKDFKFQPKHKSNSYDIEAEG